jgi:hypothetical protein
MENLLSENDLPRGFAYPREFVRVVELGLTKLEPWWILSGDLLQQRNAELAERFPARTVVLFARREDNDDIACWDTQSGSVVLLHDYSTPGYEFREELADFNSWLRRAIEDLIEFES